MAASATPPSADSLCVAVAASGGRDSTALLYATARAAQALGLRVLALHVHHGLLPEADAWVEHLRRQCADWSGQGLPVTLRWCRLDGSPKRGESIEAWARRGRYAALARMACEEEASLVLLAHHRRDQAETFMLQALRGSGMAGLAAMPKQIVRDGVLWARPWLQQPSEAVEVYVHSHGLSFVQDPSNDDLSFARNRLRHHVMPALTAAFAHTEQALCAAARQAQQARECLQALAELDLAKVEEGSALRLPALEMFPVARRVNVLRHWLGQRCGRGPSESLLQRLVQELPGDSPAQWTVGGHVLRRYRGLLRCEPACSASILLNASRQQAISVAEAGCYHLSGWGGSLRVKPVAEAGVALSRLQDCCLRERSGGEQFQRSPHSIPRSLKKQYQAEGVPSWQRGGPLLWHGDALLFVPGLGIDARLWAPPGTPQFALEWVSDTAG
ncbi:tRNA lysidine(34) synthetase TilS [Azohydromonas caseinilytica]|uniref:tRNA(Ile)-lysidine synthase n=1 Tax=Azohydromonas caseinilytica TaxID=2728836 RepID=A0A848FGL1_9BURK|nr:tRNA lysidine(34) synthetase TilS [Azohydromonas caseinilytica]NML17393.1 tRNA lysidine(34) synthetase TilS [Azohydromonas caseinilytica]